MAEDMPSSSSAPSQGENPPTVNLSIISPSLAVNTPLNFTGLPASTTVGQLKEKIREALDAKPANEQQRLIHQGKLLNRESETLLDVFGEQKLRGSDQVAVHLVIRDVDPQHASTQGAPTRDQSPAPIPPPRQSAPSVLNSAATPHHHHPGHHHHNHHLPPRFGGPAPHVGQPHLPFPAHGLGMPAPGSQTSIQLIAQQQQLMQQYLNQLNQRPVGHHGQQARGAPGLQGVPVHGQAINSQFPNLGQGRNSPHPEYQGYVRETVGPNGEVVRVTMNSAFIASNGQVFPVNLQNLQHGNAGATAPTPGGPLSTNEVQNIIRNADASQATSIMTNAMHRSASGASLANLNLNGPRQPVQNPGVTVPRRPGSTVPLSRTATPDPTRTSSHGSVSAPPANPSLRIPSSTQPEVYILSSPQGPRALLVNNQSDLYYTPAPRYPIPQAIPNFTSAWLQPPAPQPRPAFVADNAQQAAQPQPAVAQAEQQAPQAGNVRVNIFQGAAAQHQAQQQQGQARPFAPGGPQFHPANPEGGLAGVLLAALWPHLWLLIRLGVFVWWFTSSDTSWTRWFTIMAIATAVFLINTGLLNGPANNVFNPIRRHLDGLLPLAPGEDVERERERNRPPPRREVHNGIETIYAGVPPPGEQQDGPNPAQAAERLMAQRRQQNASWFVDQFRRLERAGLLFLASIAPGVAERHIQALVAQERAERERREAEERAAAEATASGTDGTAASSETQNADSPETVGEGNEQQQQEQQPPTAAHEGPRSCELQPAKLILSITEDIKIQDFSSLFSLKGKVAVVTGGSRGLGLTAASALLQAGASKVFITSRKAKACDEAVAALNKLPNLSPGAQAISVPADSSTVEGVQALVDGVKKHTDHVDILLANAGATWGEAFDTHPDSAFAKVMDLNVRAVFNTVRLFAPLLQKRASVADPSRVVITSSVAGLGVGTLGAQGTYGYSASKAGVLHLGRNLALELGPRHITVNSICPGFFPTKMSNGLMEMSGGVEKLARANPMRRLGKPEDIAGAVVYLCSRAGGHVNGDAIEIDGGALWQRGEVIAPGEAKL